MMNINPEDDVPVMDHIKILPSTVDRAYAILEMCKVYDDLNNTKSKKLLEAGISLMLQELQMRVIPSIVIDNEGKVMSMQKPEPKDTADG